VHRNRNGTFAKHGLGPGWLAACAALTAALSGACQGQESRAIGPRGKESAGIEAAASTDDGAALLAARPLMLPVEGVAPSALVDTFNEGRPGHRHEAIDILARRGSRVYAVDDGKLVKLFTSVPGGLTLYQFDPDGNLAYYYAHLDRYADGLKEGMPLRRGDLIGYVGSTGNAAVEAPHLHFAVFRLGPQRQWWKGQPINPYPALLRARPAG
jgi:murein DD-endopeptidase MepM/ murein hydrolase activator NlpD